MKTQTIPEQRAEDGRSLSDALEQGFWLYLRGVRPTLTSTLLVTLLGVGFAAFMGHAFLLPLYDIVASRFVNRHPDLFPAGVSAYLYGSAGALVLFLLVLGYFESLNLRAFVRLARGEALAKGRIRASDLERGLAFFVWMLLYILAIGLALLPLVLVILYPPESLWLGLLLVTVTWLPSLYVAVTFAFGPNSVIQDRLGPLAAFAQNFKLVSPHWWRTLSFVLIAWSAVHTVIAVFFVIALGVLIMGGLGSLRDLTAVVRVLLLALGYGTFIGGVLSLPLFNALLVVYYDDLKHRGR